MADPVDPNRPNDWRGEKPESYSSTKYAFGIVAAVLLMLGVIVFASGKHTDTASTATAPSTQTAEQAKPDSATPAPDAAKTAPEAPASTGTSSGESGSDQAAPPPAPEAAPAPAPAPSNEAPAEQKPSEPAAPQQQSQ